METIRIYSPESTEHRRLTLAAYELTRRSPTGTRYDVGDTYFDLGQGWQWTTIIAHRPDGQHYQALCPRDHAMIITDPDILRSVDTIVSDKYWSDKRRG